MKPKGTKSEKISTIKKVATKVVTKKPTVPKSSKTATKAVAKTATNIKIKSKAEATKNLPITSVKGKTAAKKFTDRVISKSASKPKSTPKTETETVSFVPGTVSLRLKEKLSLYEGWYQERSQKIVSPFAQVFGYVFIVAGLLSLYYSVLPMRNESATFSSLLAALPCLDANCGSTIIGSTTEAVVPVVIPPPQVNFLTYPVVAEGQVTNLTVQVNNASEHTLTIFSPQTGQSKNLPTPSASSDNKYVYEIPSALLAPGEYMVKVHARSLDKSSKALFTGPSFRIPPQVSTTHTGTATTANTTNTTTNTTAATPTERSNPSGEETTRGATSSVSGVGATEEVKTKTPIPATNELVEKEKIEALKSASSSAGTATTSLNNKPVTPEVVPVIPVIVKEEPLALTLLPTEGEANFRLLIKPMYIYQRIEIFAQLEQSKSPLFMGVASKSNEDWYYWLDTSNLPVGSYKLIAKGIDGGVVKATNSLSFTNKPKTVVKADARVTTDPITEKVVTATGTKDLIELRKNALTTDGIEQRNAVEQANNIVKVASTSPETPLDNSNVLAKKLIKEKGSEFDGLLKNYASALATDDAGVVRLAEAELQTRLEELAKNTVLNDSEGVSYSELETNLQSEVAKVKEKVGLFDKILRERTNDESARDSDRDGISDYDETIIYKTDPSVPDTDGDSFLDGLEIASGYDPIDASPEAIVVFASPKEASFVSEETLEVKSITPLLNFESDQPEPNIYAEVSGRGIPNSFVTIYIFSEPTVVTVKTDSEGNFSYIFTKELEDGDHEVYVAITDNGGEIVARSNPLKFVKTAEAFTYTNADSETPVPTSEVSSVPEFRLLNLVAAMGIVSFGLILLLLGKSIRRKDDEKLGLAV